MGDWDTSSTDEPLGYIERNVETVMFHPQYMPASLKNTIALLKLETRMPIGRYPTIGTACLPRKLLKYPRPWSIKFFLQRPQSIYPACDVQSLDGAAMISLMVQIKLSKGKLTFRLLTFKPAKLRCEWQDWGRILSWIQASCVQVCQSNIY